MSTDPSKIRIMTVDDHPLLRQGIATLIAGQPDMELVAEASDGEEAIGIEAQDVVLTNTTVRAVKGVGVAFGRHGTVARMAGCCALSRSDLRPPPTSRLCFTRLD